MSGIELSADRAVCHRCGRAYSKRKGNFYTSFAPLYKGLGFLPFCKPCVDTMYLGYLEEYDDPKKAIHEVCRKINLYWNEDIYKALIKKNGDKTLMGAYMARLNLQTYQNKDYDDTIAEGIQMQREQAVLNKIEEAKLSKENSSEEPSIEISLDDIPDEVIKYWGNGFTPEMYLQLEERKKYWMEGLPSEYDTGIGSDAIIKQICGLELDINKIRADGGSADKLITTLNNLIGSLNLKPSQKKDDDDTSLVNTPLGVWLYRYENERPLPVVEDENNIRKTVFTWMGHVCKMLGKKNAYTKLYEDEINRLRVEKPEYEDDDDEAFMMDVLTSDDGGDIE